MDGQELLRRRLDKCCITCGSKYVLPDPETGFEKRQCKACEEAVANTPPCPSGSSAKAEQRHKDEGLDNLDRLTKDMP